MNRKFLFTYTVSTGNGNVSGNYDDEVVGPLNLPAIQEIRNRIAYVLRKRGKVICGDVTINFIYELDK